MSVPTVLLDVDGTLVDTNHLHTLAWVRALRDQGHSVTCAEVHRMIGAGSDVLMSAVIGAADDAVKERWRSHFDELLDDIVPLPGAVELIEAVRAGGASVVLATSSPEDLVDHHLDALGLDRSDVDAVTTAADVDQAKPEPDVLQAAMETVGADPERTVLVGDSVWDVEAANRSDVFVVGVTSGGTHRNDLMGAGAAAVYADCAELLRDIERSPLHPLLDG